MRWNNLSLFWLIVVALPILACLVSCKNNTAIKGQVVDQSGKPVNGIDIVVIDSALKSTTDINGSYSLPWVDGNITISISCIDKCVNEYILIPESSKTLQLTKDRYPKGVDVKLSIFSRSNALIRGYVYDQNKHAIANAIIASNKYPRTQTNNDGYFSFIFQEGEIIINAFAPNDKQYLQKNPLSQKTIHLKTKTNPEGVNIDLQLYDPREDFDLTHRDYIIDKRTGLMWQLGDRPTISWSDADDYCSNLQIGGLSGWRMPTVMELESLYKSLDNASGHQVSRAVEPFYWSDSRDACGDSIRGLYWTSETFETRHMGWYAKYYNMEKGIVGEAGRISSCNWKNVKAVRSK